MPYMRRSCKMQIVHAEDAPKLCSEHRLHMKSQWVVAWIC